MRSIVSFSALFLAILLVQLGSGSIAPLDAIAGEHHNFTITQIGLMGSTHFLGFFIGCFITPRIIGSVGHSRAFATIAAIGVISILLHTIFIDGYIWALLRIGNGIAISGSYAIIESWLHAKLVKKNRGQVISIYRIVDQTGSIGVQGIIAFIDPASFISYNIIAILCCLSLVPLSLTKRKAPIQITMPKLRPIKTWHLSPLASMGVFISGLTVSGFRMLGPKYGIENGFDTQQIALFLGAAFLGATLAQYPIGLISDRFDRRKVLIAISASAAFFCLLMSLNIITQLPYGYYIGSLLFGAASWPLFSISSVYANDLSDKDFTVELNASLLLIYSFGAILSPLAVAFLIENFGVNIFFVYIFAAHVFLVLFGLYRTRKRTFAGNDESNNYAYAPRSSFLFGRLKKRQNEEESDS